MGTNLRAIHIVAGDPTLTVAEILQSQQPTVRPLESSPIPPINQNQEQILTPQQQPPVC